MPDTIVAIFDGEVLRPEEPVRLQTNTRYRVTITPIEPDVALQDAWDVLDRLTGTVDAPSDWSIEHDHYLYGTPKQHTAENE
jgi:hypothetical protein